MLESITYTKGQKTSRYGQSTALQNVQQRFMTGTGGKIYFSTNFKVEMAQNGRTDH